MALSILSTGVSTVRYESEPFDDMYELLFTADEPKFPSEFLEVCNELADDWEEDETLAELGERRGIFLESKIQDGSFIAVEISLGTPEAGDATYELLDTLIEDIDEPKELLERLLAHHATLSYCDGDMSAVKQTMNELFPSREIPEDGLEIRSFLRETADKQRQRYKSVVSDLSVAASITGEFAFEEDEFMDYRR